MKSNPVGWFEIYVQDMQRARAFYEAVLQGALEHLPSAEAELEMWGFPMSAGGPGAGGALVKMKDVPPGGNSPLVYFVCDDCAVEAGRVEAHGVSVHRPKMSIGPYGFIALAVDTEKNMFGLHSMR